MRYKSKMLKDYKIGEKFYDYNGLVQILLMYEEDQVNNTVKYATKEWKVGTVRTHTANGVISHMSDRQFFPYKGRDISSFYAGFRFALNLCMKHMTTEEKINAGIYKFGDDHVKMLYAYEGWLKNNVEFYPRQYINAQGNKRKPRRDALTGKYLLVP